MESETYHSDDGYEAWVKNPEKIPVSFVELYSDIQEFNNNFGSNGFKMYEHDGGDLAYFGRDREEALSRLLPKYRQLLNRIGLKIDTSGEEQKMSDTASFIDEGIMDIKLRVSDPRSFVEFLESLKTEDINQETHKVLLVFVDDMFSELLTRVVNNELYYDTNKHYDSINEENVVVLSAFLYRLVTSCGRLGLLDNMSGEKKAKIYLYAQFQKIGCLREYAMTKQFWLSEKFDPQSSILLNAIKSADNARSLDLMLNNIFGILNGLYSSRGKKVADIDLNDYYQKTLLHVSDFVYYVLTHKDGIKLNDRVSMIKVLEQAKRHLIEHYNSVFEDVV